MNQVTSGFKIIKEALPPRWEYLKDIPTVKYASYNQVKDLYSDYYDVHSLVTDMVLLLDKPKENIRIDIRYWKKLSVGERPCFNMNWHYDCFNDPTDIRGVGNEHLFFISGADCKTEFLNGFAPEDHIIWYPHEAIHRATKAKAEGPRILVRVSYAPQIPVRGLVRQML